VTKDEFFSELNRLQEDHTSGAGNIGCVEITNCQACIDCVFCKDCVRCYRSRYSVSCEDSSLLTHCDGCKRSHSLAYCQECDHCTDSNYLALSSHCSQCDYLFGCVGLVKVDFHILNKKYSRSDYFRITAKLRKELGLAPPPG
jgi:hypothetical protein